MLASTDPQPRVQPRVCLWILRLRSNEEGGTSPTSYCRPFVRSGIEVSTELAFSMAYSLASRILGAFVGEDVRKQYTLTSYQSWPVGTDPSSLTCPRMPISRRSFTEVLSFVVRVPT